MSTPQRPLRSYWVVPILRAVPAVVVGLVITFTEDHSSRVGLLAFGSFALLAGLAIAVFSARTVDDRVTRRTLVSQGVISAASGVAALAFWNGGLSLLLLIVTVFAALTGMLELYAGLRSRGTAVSRDWLTVGAYTAVAAIVFVLLPPDPVLATGLIGVYVLMLGVYLVIAGLSLKWATTAEGKVIA